MPKDGRFSFRMHRPEEKGVSAETPDPPHFVGRKAGKASILPTAARRREKKNAKKSGPAHRLPKKFPNFTKSKRRFYGKSRCISLIINL